MFASSWSDQQIYNGIFHGCGLQKLSRLFFPFLSLHSWSKCTLVDLTNEGAIFKRVSIQREKGLKSRKIDDDNSPNNRYGNILSDCRLKYLLGGYFFLFTPFLILIHLCKSHKQRANMLKNTPLERSGLQSLKSLHIFGSKLPCFEVLQFSFSWFIFVWGFTDFTGFDPFCLFCNYL